jgi:hypothetical protein
MVRSGRRENTPSPFVDKTGRSFYVVFLAVTVRERPVFFGIKWEHGNVEAQAMQKRKVICSIVDNHWVKRSAERRHLNMFKFERLKRAWPMPPQYYARSSCGSAGHVPPEHFT